MILTLVNLYKHPFYPKSFQLADRSIQVYSIGHIKLKRYFKALKTEINLTTSQKDLRERREKYQNFDSTIF